MQLTYVVSRLYTGVCHIPLGRFYGTRFFSLWQIYPSIIEKSREDPTDQEDPDDFNKEVKTLYSRQVLIFNRSLTSVLDELFAEYKAVEPRLFL